MIKQMYAFIFYDIIIVFGGAKVGKIIFDLDEWPPDALGRALSTSPTL